MIALAVSLAFAGGPPLRLDLDDLRPVRAALDLSFDPGSTTFSGTEDLDVVLGRAASRVELNAAGLQISEVTVGGKPATVEPREDGFVTLRFPRMPKGEVPIHLSFSGVVSETDTQGVFRLREGDDWYLYTEFEPQDARRAFPCVDQPDAKIPWTLTVRVPDGDGAFSNAPIRETEDLPGPSTRVTFEETPPLPTYLVAIAIGPFDVVDAGPAGRAAIPVRIVTPRDQASWATGAAEVTPALLGALEEWFDQPYPFAKLDVVALPVGVDFEAMENPGVITCVSSLLLSRPGEDDPFRERRYAEDIAHEMAHLWFGDLVTMAWWDDLWLSESFAGWMGNKMVEQRWPDWHGDVQRVVRRRDAMRADSLLSARRIREPIRAAEDIESAFDAITYDKGEAVLAMVELWLGPEAFQRGVRSYLHTYAWGNATADDFVAAMSGAAGRDLRSVFSGFLDQAGLPLLTVTEADGGFRQSVSRYLPSGGRSRERWELPVCVRWGDDGGEHRSCALLDRPSGPLELPGRTGRVAWLLPNAGATGYYRTVLPSKRTAVLLDPATPLTVAERVGVLGDAGTRDIALILDHLPPLITLDDPMITGQTAGWVARLDRHVVPEALRPNYERMVITLYGPTADRLGLVPRTGESVDDRMLRPTIAGLVGGLAEAPALQVAARPLANQWLEDRTGVEPDLVDTVLSLALRHEDRSVFNRIVAEATSETDRERRAHLLTALGAFRSPDLAIAALEVAFSGTFDVRETFVIVSGVLSHRETRDVAWAYFQEHIDAIADVFPTIARGNLPYLASGFCDPVHRDEADALFRPRVDAWVGGRLTLEQVLEGIDVCAASVARQEESISRALAAY